MRNAWNLKCKAIGLILPVIILALAAAQSAAGQTMKLGRALPRIVNCGDLNGHAVGEPGYELFSETQWPADFYLNPAPLDTVHVAGNFQNYYGKYPIKSEVLCVDPDQIHRTHLFTSLQLADNTVLRVENLTPLTPYRLRVEAGALYPWGDLVDPINFAYYSTLSKGIRIEVQDPAGGLPITWLNSASNISCYSSHSSTTYASDISGITTLWVLAYADASGKLRVRFSSDGADPVFLAGVELHDHEILPMVYQRTGGQALQGNTPGVSAFVTAFNNHDYAGAETAALAMTDDFERGVALTYLIGWLDGSRDGYFHHLEGARSALLAAGPSHPGAAWLVDELTLLERALSHLDASGHTMGFKSPAKGGKGYLNPEVEDQITTVGGLNRVNANTQIAIREMRGIIAARNGATVLQDLVDWNQGAIPANAWEPSPLIFACLKLTGASMLSMNPKLAVTASDPDSVALAQDRDLILENLVDLGFSSVDFPRDLELILLDYYAKSGQPPSKWSINDIQTLLTDPQIDGSWWGADVALLADDPLAPAWADLQRDQDRISRNLARYWLSQRYKDNELGGGWGDDVELLGQLSKLFVGRQDQTDRRMLDSMQRMIQYGLYRSGEVIDGYFGGGMTDVEHSGEYTTYPYITSRHLFGHMAQNGETALGVARHLAYTAQPAKAFAGLTNLGRLHFKSYYFTTEGPSTDPARQIDILLNGRALYPAVAAGLHGALDDSQIMIADLADWARAWRDDAQETTGGKPAGWYGPVQWPSNIFGKSGNWWTHTGTPSDLSAFTSGVYGYTLELLRMAYRTSQASDRWTYLLPLVRMFRAVKDWEDAGMPVHSAGTNFWAAEQFKNSNHFGAFVISFRPDLEHDPDLTSLVDPLGSGHTYVDSGLLDRMETWAEDEWCGQHTMIKYALNEIDESGSAHTAKPIYFDNAYAEVTTYYRTVFPLLTKHAMHTDRVFITYGGGGPNNLIACATGTDFREGLATRPLVRWNSRLRPGQDMAIQCNYRNYDATQYSALVYSFESAAMDTTVMLDEGLVPGSYLVEWGEGTSTSDVFLTGTPTTSVMVQKPGRGVAVDLTLEPGLNLVRVIRQGDANPPAAAYDLAVDPPNVQFLVQGANIHLQLKARVANLGLVPSPSATMNFYVSLINSDGSIIQYPGFPKEIFVSTNAVPPLAATGSWDMDEHEVLFSIPVDNLIVSIFLTGRGFQLRTAVTADGLEMDLLNNNQVQARTLKDVDVFYQ